MVAGAQISLFGPEQTIRATRDRVLREAENGTTCPVCDGHVQVYRRKLNSTMAAAVCWLVRHCRETGKTWVDVPKSGPRWVIATNQLGTVSHWGLVEQLSETDDAKRTSGIWRPTYKGRAFAAGGLRAPERVVLLHNRVLGWSEETIDVRGALGRKFNYQELMWG